MFVWILAICLTSAYAQESPAFEVASVKPSTPKSIRMFDGGPGTRDPGRISWTKATLLDLIIQAYNLQDSGQVSGPVWLSSEPYDIAAAIPPGTTKEQFRLMLQRLLSERFKLELHRQQKDFPVYFLEVAKNGPKLKPPGTDPNREGFPEIPPDKPGMSMNYAGTRARLTAHRQTLARFAGMLRSTAGRMVLDRTGLDGTFDFTLEFNIREAAGQPSTDPDPLPPIFQALPQQLGLRLVDGKIPLDLLIVDHAERVPTGN